MKVSLTISIGFNLALLGGLVFILANQRKGITAVARVSSEARPSAQAAVASTPAVSSGLKAKPFRWQQLESTKDYRLYVANLRAIGCPEATVEDIVQGDADRAFSWERSQLGLDGAGTGPWSRSREMQLVASLLGVPTSTVAAVSTQNIANPAGANSREVAQTPVSAHDTKTVAPSYPLFLQKNVNWSALGFTADQQAAIAQVRQQFLSATGSLNQDPNSVNSDASSTSSTDNPRNVPSLSQWQEALQIAYNQLRDALGVQGYLSYEQQEYDNWYYAQLKAANGRHLAINPAEFSLFH